MWNAGGLQEERRGGSENIPVFTVGLFIHHFIHFQSNQLFYTHTKVSVYLLLKNTSKTDTKKNTSYLIKALLNIVIQKKVHCVYNRTVMVRNNIKSGMLWHSTVARLESMETKPAKKLATDLCRIPTKWESVYFPSWQTCENCNPGLPFSLYFAPGVVCCNCNQLA